jgi:hypothetical protein
LRSFENFASFTRFPENFMFQLTEQEAETMVSQNAIPSKQVLGGTSEVSKTSEAQ